MIISIIIIQSHNYILEALQVGFHHQKLWWVEVVLDMGWQWLLPFEQAKFAPE